MVSAWTRQLAVSARGNRLAEVLRYAVSGVINTVVGYGVFWIALRWARLTPEMANAIGYGVALGVAFVLNRVYVFQGARLSVKAGLRFAISFMAAFTLNQAVLVFLIDRGSLAPEIAQIFAMITYTIAFYLLNKHFVFAARQEDAKS